MLIFLELYCCVYVCIQYRILCLSLAVMFLVCGDVSTCIFSACWHASHKLRRIGIIRMSPSCSINNNNRVAKFSETLIIEWLHLRHNYQKDPYARTFGRYRFVNNGWLFMSYSIWSLCSSRGVVASATDLERAGWRFNSHCGQLF